MINYLYANTNYNCGYCCYSPSYRLHRAHIVIGLSICIFKTTSDSSYSTFMMRPPLTVVTTSMVTHFSPLNLPVTRERYMVSKLLKGRGLGLQVSCKSFPMVYSWLRRYVDRGNMTYNYYLQCPFVFTLSAGINYIQGPIDFTERE